ncbi:DinB family protein [Paludifilum halophilum]|uniref:Uncharacterized protein n=1 Tax=Paludifilum halophilum TaxID=1642702 RepID=A0A235B1I2_9BACL|nr:DinB family protein [Paludifilum halophilum]OYD06166.1 hypothetical protein CHM34_17615 [Paludifilum halophilum]
MPLHVIRVADLNTSVTFYRDKLGFSMQWYDSGWRTASFIAPGEIEILLTGDPELDISALFPESIHPETPSEDPGMKPLVEEVAPREAPLQRTDQPLDGDEQEWGNTDAEELPKGEPEADATAEEEVADPGFSREIKELTTEEPLRLPGEDLFVYQERLIALGVPDMLLEENPGVEQVLSVTDPDGYKLAFHESLRLSDEEVFDLYRKGPDLLDGAVLGLTDEDLDLSPEEGEWSIRQTVLHIVDFDLEMTERIKWALAEPGRSYNIPLFDPDEWAETFDYARRPVQGELAMFRLLRDHILRLCENVPDAMDRSLVSERGTVEVRTMMQVVGETTRELVQGIMETRGLYGK